MTNGEEELEVALAKLRAKYLAEVPQRLTDVLAELAKAESGDSAAMQNARLLLHRLAGSAGNYGFGVATTRAREAEGLAARLSEGGSPPSPAQAADLRRLIADLQAAFRPGGR